MLVHESIPESGVPRFGVSPADYVDMTEYQQSTFERSASTARAARAVGNRRSRAGGRREMTASVFAILGVAPTAAACSLKTKIAGRIRGGHQRALWQRRFAGRIQWGRGCSSIASLTRSSASCPRRSSSRSAARNSTPSRPTSGCRSCSILSSGRRAGCSSATASSDGCATASAPSRRRPISPRSDRAFAKTILSRSGTRRLPSSLRHTP